MVLHVTDPNAGNISLLRFACGGDGVEVVHCPGVASLLSHSDTGNGVPNNVRVSTMAQLPDDVSGKEGSIVLQSHQWSFFQN